MHQSSLGTWSIFDLLNGKRVGVQSDVVGVRSDVHPDGDLAGEGEIRIFPPQMRHQSDLVAVRHHRAWQSNVLDLGLRLHGLLQGVVQDRVVTVRFSAIGEVVRDDGGQNDDGAGCCQQGQGRPAAHQVALRPFLCRVHAEVDWHGRQKLLKTHK
jgi:hypothetical protein